MLDKPLQRKVAVWWSLRTRAEVIIVVLAFAALVALSELVLDGLTGTVPEQAHLKQVGLGEKPLQTDEDRKEWLEKCVARAPRLWRPAEGGTHRMHSLNRHLFCLAASPMLPTPGLLFDGCEGAGATGMAMWLGARTVENRQVVVAHESNDRTYVNFGEKDAKSILLAKDQDPVESLQKACSRHASVVCAAAGEPLSNHLLAMTALRQCDSAHFVALTGMVAEELKRVAADLKLTDWHVLASGVDHKYYAPIFAPLCYLRLGLWCTRVPWIIVTRNLKYEPPAEPIRFQAPAAP